MSVVAIASDSIEDMAALQTKLLGVRLVTDPKLVAAEAWGVHEPGAESPTPSTFIVGGDGVIQWRKLPDSHGDWPTYDELVAGLKG